MRKKFVGLDVLRFSLALYLMVFHTVHTYPQLGALRFNELLGLGSAATSTFFILSGFVLAHVYFGDGSSTVRGGTRDFLVKRLTNLYPIHLISLALFVAVLVVTGGSVNHYTLVSMVDLPVPSVTLGPVEALFNRVLTLLMLDTWNPLYVTLNPPAWSLSVLMFFYLCFPLLAPRLLFARYPRRALLLIWVAYLIPPVVASTMHWYGPPAAGIVTSNPILRLPEFMAGIVFYGMYRSGHLIAITRVAGWKMYALAFAALCFVGGAWLTAHGPTFWQYIVHNGAMLPAELALMLVAAHSMEHSSVRVARWAARLGNAALSIFAIHLSLFFVFFKLQKLLALGISPLACFQHVGRCIAASKAVTPSLSVYPLYLLGTVIVAVCFQEIVVVTVRDALRRRLLAKPTQKAGVEKGAAARSRPITLRRPPAGIHALNEAPQMTDRQ